MTDDAPGLLPVGSRLGRYQVIRRLALGGMAELYLVRQLGEAGYEKVVALKRVLPHLAEDPEFVEMFLNEARLAAGLNHSAIAQVMDFGTEAGEHYMTLEYVHGRSVFQLLRESGRALPRAVALTVAHEVAGALHYAHERCGADGRPLGLVHRDVSPSNILVSYDGDVKLVDFGIAKATAHSHATQTAAIKGKIAYMAPEQLRGETLDRRTDVFALCVVLYEMLLGKRCFSAPGEFALINKVADARFTKPSKIDADMDPELEAIVVEGLCADPDARPPSARALQTRLEAFASSRGLQLSRVALAEFMEKTFGLVDFPRTDSLPLPAVAAAVPLTAMEDAVPRTPCALAVDRLGFGCRRDRGRRGGAHGRRRCVTVRFPIAGHHRERRAKRGVGPRLDRAHARCPRRRAGDRHRGRARARVEAEPIQEEEEKTSSHRQEEDQRQTRARCGLSPAVAALGVTSATVRQPCSVAPWPRSLSCSRVC